MLLANLSPYALHGVIERHGLPALTARTLTDRGALERELSEISKRGLSIEQGEAVDDVSCVAAPIIAPGPTFVAAISIAAPTFRFNQRRAVYSQAVARAGVYVSQCLSRAEEESAQATPALAAAGLSA
jgi:DNA-binding IclR family transcriptional regulator